MEFKKIKELSQLPFIIHQIKNAIDIAFEERFIIDPKRRSYKNRKGILHHVESIHYQDYSWRFCPERIDYVFTENSPCLYLVNLEQLIALVPSIKENTLENFNKKSKIDRPYITIKPSINLYFMQPDCPEKRINLLWDPIVHYTITSTANVMKPELPFVEKIDEKIYKYYLRVYYPYFNGHRIVGSLLKITELLTAFADSYFVTASKKWDNVIEIPSLLKYKNPKNKEFNEIYVGTKNRLWNWSSTFITPSNMKTIDEHFCKNNFCHWNLERPADTYMIHDTSTFKDFFFIVITEMLKQWEGMKI